MNPVRTDAEVVAEIHRVSPMDIFGFYSSELIVTLPYTLAQPFLNESATAEDYGHAKPRDTDSIKGRVLDYMQFAWDKANDRRGLSAMRSLARMKAWLWLLGEDALAAKMDNYTYYGKPQLRAICIKYGWDWKRWDDGSWVNNDGDDGVGPNEVPEI
jgi:hypothetical protein